MTGHRTCHCNHFNSHGSTSCLYACAILGTQYSHGNPQSVNCLQYLHGHAVNSSRRYGSHCNSRHPPRCYCPRIVHFTLTRSRGYIAGNSGRPRTVARVVQHNDPWQRNSVVESVSCSVNVTVPNTNSTCASSATSPHFSSTPSL